MAFEFLFLLGKTTKLRLCHFNITADVLAITVVAFSRTKVYLIDKAVLCTATAFLNHSVSETVDEVGEIKTAGSASRGSTNSRHLAKP